MITCEGVVVRIVMLLAIWLAQSPAAFADCAAVRDAAAPPQLWQATREDQQAQWAHFLDLVLGPTANGANFTGCKPDQSVPKATVCILRFDLGDPDAQQAFARIDAKITDCLAPDLQRQRDAPVNHPDSYDAFLYQLPGHRITLSIKNKSALGATFVTLRAFGPD